MIYDIKVPAGKYCGNTSVACKFCHTFTTYRRTRCFCTLHEKSMLWTGEHVIKCDECIAETGTGTSYTCQLPLVSEPEEFELETEPVTVEDVKSAVVPGQVTVPG